MAIQTTDLKNAFDQVVVINLARRSERMARFRQRFQIWPFKTPQRFEAIDGFRQTIPANWTAGPGAWGCRLSHMRILDSAISEGVSSLLVLEDDAMPAANFLTRAVEFLANAPIDWDCLMLGAEHLERPIEIRPGIVRCIHSNRTHAYAIRGRMMPVLLEMWKRCDTDHCDIVLASLMPLFNVYAPNPPLIGQDAGLSDVTERDESVRFLAA